MSDKRIETWRVESEDGEIEELTITYAHYYWQGECKGTLGNVAGWPRAAAAKVAAKCHMSVVSILAPGEPTRAEALAAERERLAALLRDHADDRVNDAPEYAEAIYDAEALVRGERPVYAPRATLAESLASAWRDGAAAMRDAAVAAVKLRAEALDASVTEEEAADDEEGYGRFQEALELVEVLGALPIPEATNTETK